MNKMQISICILAASVFIASVSQILLKMSANREHGSWLKEYLNPVLGYFFLGERFSRRKVLGFAVILCGILIFSLGS